MMDSNYGIGGNEVKSDASEAFADIPQNRTLMMEKLTKDAPVKPQIVHGIQTIEQVFAEFKPEVEVEFDDDLPALEDEPEIEERIPNRPAAQ